MIKLVELFGGIGSFRKSLENLDYKVDCTYIDIDKHAIMSYNLLFNENEKPIDIKQYSYKENKKIDILTAGFPCQDISMAGKQDLSKGRSMLFQEIIRIVSEIETDLKPDFIIIENVKNILNKKNYFIVEHITNSFKKMGYYNRIEILNSLNFGIPQNRERCFMIFSKTKDKLLLKTQYTEMKPLITFLENKSFNKFKWKKIEKYKDYTNFIVIPRKKKKR